MFCVVDEVLTKLQLARGDFGGEGTLHAAASVRVCLDPQSAPTLIQQQSRVVLQSILNTEFNERLAAGTDAPKDLLQDSHPRRSERTRENRGVPGVWAHRTAGARSSWCRCISSSSSPCISNRLHYGCSDGGRRR
jgi:hypothetical protein